ETIDHRKQYKWSPKTDSAQSSFFGDSEVTTKVARKGVHYEYEGHDSLQKGRIVLHPTFGRGRVLSIEGYGESLRLEIMFTGHGVKTIMAKYGKLKIIG
ncbi:MAG: hypothetical protein U9R56_00645, partial [candidate division Zixibacteria bacterium]|nr:hypothetical protein [candidate division Zixibacteria bacterium]